MTFLCTVVVPSVGLHDAHPSGLTASSSVSATSAGVMVPAHGASLLDAVMVALREAAEQVAFESFAAERIQATYRMHKTRQIYLRHRHAVLNMQRVYRGWRQRQATLALRAREAQRCDVYLFHYYATRIQTIFRGYQSRKHRCDFYARKAYVDAVTVESEAVRALVNDFHEEQVALESLQSRLRESDAYANATSKVHHLLSTAAVSGVYRRPLAMTGTATTFGTNVEADIRQNTSDARRPDIERDMRKNASVPVRPAATVSDVSNSTRAVRAAARTKASTPPPPNALDASQGPVTPDGRVVASPSAANDGIGLAATLPPIRSRTLQKGEHASHAPASQTHAVSCAWENPDARPTAKPLVDPADVTVKAPKRSKMVNASTGKSSRGAAGVLGSASPSSFDKEFKVASHDCSAGYGKAANAARSASGHSNKKSAAPFTSTYDTETAALQKSVDAKVMRSLHGDAVFKVRAPKA